MSYLRFTHPLNSVLLNAGLLHIALLIIFAAVAMFDHRQVLSINLWVKPIKFALSIAIYCFTWAWIITYLPSLTIQQNFAWFTAGALLFEMVAIASQAALGKQSHFNVSTPYSSVLFALMGVAIVMQTLFALYVGILFFKVMPGALSPAMLWAIRLGIITACIFAFQGGYMGSKLSHTVGATDGGTGLPVLNWSRTAGDLRVAHFVGLHALQIIPLFVALLGISSAAPVIWFSIGYFLLTSALFYQALLGRPLL
ncbi:hypothetical protein [Mucilaginibacter sp. CSA2-8R]|uniref:hypothetical protein n=1 Tax=Mucilaginibacter sp. CSA2-8R TaxID=3141542 RepID=UPI00315D6607